MSNFFRRLFCVNNGETLNNENEDPLVTKTPWEKLLELETTINSKFQSLDLKLEEKLNANHQNTLTVVEKVPVSVEEINNKLDLLQKKLLEVEQKVDKTLEFVEKKVALEEVKKEEDTKEVQIEGTQGVKKGDTPSSDDPFENVTTGASWKEHRFLTKTYKTLYPIDHPSLNNIKVKREGEKLTYLMMNIAVRATNYATILLSPVQNPGYDNYVFEIVLGHKKFKLSHTTKPGYGSEKYKYEYDRAVLPTDKFGLYYLLIDNGSLEFWTDSPRYTGHYRSFFNEKDENLANIKYFGFNLFPDREHMFLFDCTGSFEGALQPVHSY